eukprot:4350146-Pyramimonas_sp.AAC.1
MHLCIPGSPSSSVEDNPSKYSGRPTSVQSGEGRMLPSPLGLQLGAPFGHVHVRSSSHPRPSHRPQSRL